MRTRLLAVLLVWLAASSAWAGGPFNIKLPVSSTGIDPQAVTVVGSPQRHVIKKGEDLLEVALHYDLGWTEIGAM